MARTISPPRTSRRSPPTQRHPSSSTPTTTTSTAAAPPHLDTNTNTSTTSSTVPSPALQRAAERSNVPIAPAASNTSSPIYSTTSSPPISPGISQYPSSSLGTMAPSRSDSRTATLTMDLPPTSTPTGRISKAKKGKRVHACEFPGCGKVFTRAEHRRRHELNHNPDATYRCGQHGCGKSFHRVDLLQRHQERHELEASTQPSSPGNRRYPTHSAVLPEPPSSMPAQSMSSPPMAPVPPRTSAGGMSIPSLINNHHQYVSEASSFPVHTFMPYFSTGEPWETVYVTDAMHSPAPRGHTRQNISSASSVVSFDHSSGSPMVTASMPQQSWTQALPPNVLPANMFEEGMSPYPSSAAVNAKPIPLSELDGYEWSSIGRELSSVSGLLPSHDRAGVFHPLRTECLDLYWQYFHPTYPIIHMPTCSQPPPLLLCAMVAIGSYYDTATDAKQYSLTLLEIATKTLRRRPSNISKKPRIEDLQTVLLLEILSTFCARQISVQVSGKFRSLFASLPQSPAQSPLAVFRTLRQDRSISKLAHAQEFWIELETRNRIFHACSVLDSQQSILFEQPPTVRRHPNLKQVNLPCDDKLWDADTLEKWAEIAEKHEYIQLSGGRPVITPGNSRTDYSYFQQQVINANADGIIKCEPLAKATCVASDEKLSKSRLDYHATWMCKHTPVRSLLLVTGESWLLGHKAEKATDYKKAKVELRKWVEGSTMAKKSYSDSNAAHWHALKLLQILRTDASHRTNPGELFGTTHMLHESWVVYLATLICWAQGHRKSGANLETNGFGHGPDTHGLVNGNGGMLPVTNGGPKQVARSETSCLSNPARATQEAETYLIFTDVSSPSALHDLDPAVLSRTQGLLEAVRTQNVTKHMVGGLMNDAEQTLLRLVQGKKGMSF